MTGICTLLCCRWLTRQRFAGLSRRRRRNPVAELGGGVEPEGDGGLDLRQRGFVGVAVRHAAREVGRGGDEDGVLVAPRDGHGVSVHRWAHCWWVEEWLPGQDLNPQPSG